MSKQYVVTHGFLSGDKVKRLSVMDDDQSISWKRFTKGSVRARFSTHVEAKWLDLSLDESYVGEKGKVVSKQTMMSIDQEGARALYEMLKEVFEV